MDIIPNMFRAALGRITSSSSIASTAGYGFFTRVLSITGSFNDRTSLLLDAEVGPAAQVQQEPAPPPQAVLEAAASAPAAASVHAFDIEAAETTTTTPLAPSPASEVDAESKRVGKNVQPVCLFAASASLVLFVNLPNTTSSKVADGAAAVYVADLAFIGLGFFSSLTLSMFSVAASARPGEAAVARLQKWGMMVAVGSVIVAFSLRMGMMPVA